MNLPLKPFQSSVEVISPPSHRMTIILGGLSNLEAAGGFMRANHEKRQANSQKPLFHSPYYQLLLEQKKVTDLTTAATLNVKSAPELAPTPQPTILDGPDTADLGIIEAMARETLAEEAQMATSQVDKLPEQASNVIDLAEIRARAYENAMPKDLANERLTEAA